MARPQTPEDVRAKGEHFLVNDSVVRGMVEASGIGPGSRVLDVGSGGGFITRPLAEAVGKSGKVYAIELQSGHARRLQERMPYVAVTTGDALKVDLPTPVPDAVVANPSYRILAPLVLRLLDHRIPRLVLVMPRELQQRLCARPGSEAYGVLSIQVGARAVTRMLFAVPKASFDPPPAVASCVVQIDLHARQPAEPDSPVPASANTLRILEEVLETVWPHRLKSNRHAWAPVAHLLNIPPMAVTTMLGDLLLATRRPIDMTPIEYVAAVRRLEASPKNKAK